MFNFLSLFRSSLSKNKIDWVILWMFIIVDNFWKLFLVNLTFIKIIIVVCRYRSMVHKITRRSFLSEFSLVFGCNATTIFLKRSFWIIIILTLKRLDSFVDAFKIKNYVINPCLYLIREFSIHGTIANWINMGKDGKKFSLKYAYQVLGTCLLNKKIG